MTAWATRSGGDVPSVGGAFSPVSAAIRAYMPASETKPGLTAENPTPSSRCSTRSERVSPMRPAFVEP